MSPLSHHLHRACAHTLKTAVRQSPLTAATTTSLLTCCSSSSSSSSSSVPASFSTTSAALVQGPGSGTGTAKRFRHAPIRCLRCNEPGHWVRDCPNPKRCYNCGQEGHDINRCPSPQRCHRCGEEGHLMSACPEKYKIPHCYLCGGRHEPKACTYKIVQTKDGKMGPTTA